MDAVRISELLAATKGTWSGPPPAGDFVGGVSCDSRMVEEGHAFWALTGTRHDGHDFTHEAHARGAAVCVVDRRRELAAGTRRIDVDDPLMALRDFAGWYRTTREALVIGVTGSVGKTTTREMIHAVLSAEHSGTRSPGNYNNELGMPLSLLQIERTHDFAVLELGARRGGEIRALCEIARPEMGVLTAVAPAHLETFGSLDGIAAAKGELLEAIPRHGLAVVAGDDPLTRSTANRATCRAIRVGEHEHNDLRATDVRISVADAASVGRTGRSLNFRAAGHEYAVPAAGRHYLTAALAAVAIAREIGMAPGRIADGLRQFRPPAGRCQIEHIVPWKVIDDTYNASPLSMQAAVRLLADWRGDGKRIFVTGDMLELGPDSRRYHRQLGAAAAEAGIECLLSFGEFARDVIRGGGDAGMKAHQLAECVDFQSLLAVLDCCLSPGDVVLVKGSRGMRMERVVEWLRQSAGAQQAVA